MQRLKIETGVSAAVFLLSVALIVIFPRETHPVFATVLAIVFWLALLITAFFTYLLIHNYRRKRKWQKDRLACSSRPPGKRPKSRSPANTAQNRVYNVNSHNGGNQDEQF